MDENTNDIQITYCWTAEELLRGYCWAYRCRIHRVFRWALLLLPPIFIGVGIFLIWQSASLADVFPLLFAGLFIPIYRRCIFPWLIRRQFAKRPDRNADIEWHISGERIHIQHGLGASEFVWAALSKVVQTPEGFLFFPNNQIFHWLPKHGFEADADFEQLAELSRQRASNFFRIP